MTNLPYDIIALTAEYLIDKSLINLMTCSKELFHRIDPIINYKALILEIQRPYSYFGIKTLNYNFETYYKIINGSLCIDCAEYKSEFSDEDVVCNECYNRMLDEFGLGDDNYYFEYCSIL